MNHVSFFRHEGFEPVGLRQSSFGLGGTLEQMHIEMNRSKGTGFKRHDMFERGGRVTRPRAGRTVSLPVVPRPPDHHGVRIHEPGFEVIGVPVQN